jgi:hypothetical protein
MSDWPDKELKERLRLYDLEKRLELYELEECERLYPLVNLRMDEMGRVGHILAKAARRARFFAILCRATLIIMGSLVVTRGVAEQLEASLVSSKSVRMMIIMIYTLIGVIVATIGSFELAFKFTERGAALTLLAANAWNLSRRYMGLIHAAKSAKQLDKLMREQNYDLNQMHEQAAKFGISLVPYLKKAGIDYSQS